MRRLGGMFILASLALTVSCGTPPRAVREAASLEEAQKLVAGTGGLIVIEFWADG